jgi:hypothetical protein
LEEPSASVFRVETVCMSFDLKKTAGSSETVTVYHITSYEFVCMKNVRNEKAL